MSTDWLVLAYSLPPEPSRKRVAVWRRMRKLGAVYLNEGIWFVPKTPGLARAIEEVAREVQAEGGTAWAFQAEAMLADERADLAARFNAARESEYGEIVRQCERFLSHIRRETEGNHFEFAIVEELEQDLEKRMRLLKQVGERDVLEARGREGAEEQLQECRLALDAFAEAAFIHTP